MKDYETFLRAALWSWRAMSAPSEPAGKTNWHVHFTTFGDAGPNIEVKARRLSYGGRDALYDPERTPAHAFGRLLLWVFLGETLPQRLSPAETWRRLGLVANPKASAPSQKGRSLPW